MRLPVISAKPIMQPSRIRIGSLLLAIGLVAATCGHAQDEGTVTLIRDASLRVIRGLWVLQAVEGMRLRQGDYLLTGSAPTTQAQLEFRDGSVVELGPSSRVYLFDLRASTTAIIVVAGWVKGETTRGNLDYFSHAGSVTTNGGRVLLHLNGDA